MITTLLDTDLYKFTTSYAYMKLFPYAVGTFAFKDRDETVYTPEFIARLKEVIKDLEKVRLSNEELEYMSSTCRFFPRLYWEWLSSFHFEADKIKIYLDEDKHLNIEVTDFMYKATLYEVPLLALVSEVKNEVRGNIPDIEGALKKLDEKVTLSNEHNLPFSEFGTRRRFSHDMQDIVIDYLVKNSKYFSGTSNCYFAMKYKIKSMGTHPHEWFMFHGAQFGYKHANYMALENWVRVYDGDLGIALSDTFTTKAFLSNFSRKQAKLFDGVRCDSGDEFEFTRNLIARYKEFGIDAATKTIVFSNALDFGKALDLQEFCRGKIGCAFGIGTNLTNDTEFKPSNIVMKLTRCKMNTHGEWQECIKLSDDRGKHLGSNEEVEACCHDLGLEIDK